MQQTIFDPCQVPITCLPGETAYSIIGRWVRRAGLTEKQGLFRLFRQERIRIHPYLPCHLRDLEAYGFGNSDHILWNHSLYPAFAAVAGPLRRRELIEAMMDDASLKVAHVALLSSSHIKFSNVIKYCPVCAVEDLECYGVSFWHNIHQVPGVAVCFQHGTVLLDVKLRQSGWDELLMVPQSDMCPKPGSLGDFRFAKFADDFLKYAKKNLPQLRMPYAYLRALAAKGCVTKQGNLRREKAQEKYQCFLDEVWGPNKPEILPNARKLSSLLNERSCLRLHIYYHLMFSFWLFGEIGMLESLSQRPCLRVSDAVAIKKDERREAAALLQTGLTLTACSRAIGRSRTWLKRVAALNGITTGAPSLASPPSVNQTVGKLALKGDSIASISEETGISESQVCTIISATAGLVRERQQKRMTEARNRHREFLLNFLREKPDCLRKDVARHLKQSFYWLYRNDKKWLYEHLPEPTKPSPNMRVDWQERDDWVVRKISKLCPGRSEIKSWVDADRLLGGRNWFPRYQTKLPESSKLLRTIIRKDAVGDA